MFSRNPLGRPTLRTKVREMLSLNNIPGRSARP